MCFPPYFIIQYHVIHGTHSEKQHESQVAKEAASISNRPTGLMKGLQGASTHRLQESSLHNRGRPDAFRRQCQGTAGSSPGVLLYEGHPENDLQ